MTDLNKQISEFLHRRKTAVAEILKKGGEQEERLLKAYGAPSAMDAAVAGAEQGLSHGFADDIERASRPDHVAQSQIRAKAAQPLAYEASTVLGTMLAAGGLRSVLGLAGRQASAGARTGARVSGAAGASSLTAKNAKRAEETVKKWTTMGMKPQHRGTVMDAGHGAAWGYGGADVQANEGAFDPARFLRAGVAAGGSAVIAPMLTSAVVAGTNIPLAFGQRRLFSKKMLEPPGVTKQNPAGRPRDAIEIARSRDESAARGSNNVPAPPAGGRKLDRALPPPKAPGEFDGHRTLRSLLGEPTDYLPWHHNPQYKQLAGRVREQVGEVPVRQIRAGQNQIRENFRDVPRRYGNADADLPILVRENGVYYINDGTHRIAASVANGADRVRARIIDLDAAAGRPSTSGVGLIARDTARPMESNFHHVQKLADQALAPVARDRIGDLKVRERNASAAAIERQHPLPLSERPYAGVPERRFSTQGGKKYVVEFAPAANEGVSVAFRRDRKGLARSLTNDFGSNGKTSLRETKDVLNGVQQAISEDIGDGGRAYYSMMGSDEKRGRIYDRLAKRAKPPEGYDVSSMPGAGAVLGRTRDTLYRPDPFVDEMMEAFVRQDRPALDSWMSTLQGAAKKDPDLLPRIHARVAQQLAINERSDPRLNDTPVMREFLHALGLSGNKAKGTPNVLEAARAPAREQYPTERFEQALDRTKDEMPMRPRHADRMRDELENFKPGAYTGPEDARRGPPLVARGDDEPYWLNPLDFLKDGKVNDAEVNATGFLSGPVAYGLERLGVGPATEQLFGDPDHIETPETPAARPPIATRGAFADMQPQAPSAPVVQQGAFAGLDTPAPQSAAPSRAPETSGEPIRDIQSLLMDAGIDVGPEGNDGQVGPNTARAIEVFARITNMPGEITPERVLARLRAYPRDALAADLAAGLKQ
jgi:hypothetical protein